MSSVRALLALVNSILAGFGAYLGTDKMMVAKCDYFEAVKRDVTHFRYAPKSMPTGWHFPEPAMIPPSLLRRAWKRATGPWSKLDKYLFGVGLVMLTVSSYKLYRCLTYRSPIGNDWKSRYVSFLVNMAKQPVMATCTIRSLFGSSPDVTNYVARNHTHGRSACVRNNAGSFMDLFCKVVGRTAYYLQLSAADVRKGRQGCRTFHWVKDLTVQQRVYAPPSDAVICIVDVDMYIDMPKLLTDNFHPVLLTTFQPSDVAKADGDYSFTFNKNNEVVYTVAGGAQYVHEVWSYGNDVIVASVRDYFGLVCFHHVYNVDRRRMDEHHELILLTPIRRIVSPFFSATSWVQGAELQRLRVVEKVKDEYFTRLNINTTSGSWRATGRPDMLISAKVTAKQDDTVACMARVSKNLDITPASVKTAIEGVDQTTATILTDYHRMKTTTVADYVFPVEASVFKFQHSPATYDPDAKPSLKPFMSPVVLGAYAPDKCYNNDKAAVDGRVLSLQAKVELEITPKLTLYMDEFSEMLVPQDEANTGVPLDFETVHERQSRPAQRLILERAGLHAASSVDASIQTFQKSEAYGKVTDPRIISTIPGVNKYNYSRYIYAFTVVLRRTPWYAFGKKPTEIAARVAEICTQAQTVVNTDLSRFDGRVAKALRTLEHLIMMRYFRKEYHRELCELMASQKNQRAWTTFGVSYETLLARLSGSAETADFNTIDNAFMAYIALRDSGLSPIEAWKKLGIYGGDDGITADVKPETYVKACATVGQVLDVQEVKRGDYGVSFLSREYGPDVWHGATDSMCDVQRQLSKLHTTVSLPPNITAFQKAAQKLYSYYLTDKNTPIIGDIARTFVETFPDHVPKPNERMAELSTYHSLGEEQFPNLPGPCGWMEDRVRKQMPDFDRDRLESWLQLVRRTKDQALMLAPPLCGSLSVTHEVKVPVVVNGEVATPPPAKAQPRIASVPAAKGPRKEFTPEDLARMALIPCRELAKGNCKYAKCRFKH